MKTSAPLHPAIEPLETRIAPATVFAITDNNGLFSFDSETPGTVSATTPITGLGGGELIKAMDFRPATGELYGIAISGAAAPFTGRLYEIDPTTAVATAVGAAFSTTLTRGVGYGMDFNPTVDRIRIVNGNEENIRLNPDTGAIAATDTAITGANTLAALAYTNNYPGAASTTLYAIEYNTDDLMLIGGLNSNPSPNSGVATKVKDISVSTDVSTEDRVGFDILTTLDGNTAFYSGRFSNQYRLYTLDLATGSATLAGAIGNGTTLVTDIAVQPAAFTFPDGKSFTYTDGDGDLVTVKTSAGTLKSSQFSWLTSADGTRRELRQMNISQDTTFTGANLSFTAKKTATGGDGRVDIGLINATFLNLGAVKIGGNIESLQLGNNDPLVPSMKSFSALSVGRAGAEGDLGRTSFFLNGTVPVFSVKGDITNAFFNQFKAGTFTVGGSIIGGAGADSCLITINVQKSAVIGGSIIGGDGSSSATVLIGGNLASMKLGGSIVGGVGAGSGRLLTAAANVVIGGSIIGGDGDSSGQFTSNATIAKTLKVGGSVIGGDGTSSGRALLNSLASLTLGGSIVAGDGSLSGAFSGLGVKAVKIGGSIIGGTTGNTGIASFGTVGTFTLGGSLVSGKVASGYSGQLQFFTAKTATINGAVVGQPGAPALINIAGNNSPSTVAESIALGSLTIKGSVINAEILIGAGTPGTIDKGDVAAGKITVGRDFTASSITAGVGRGADKFFGNADDVPGMITNAGIKATIASIVIKGRATGTSSDSDHYGIVAEQLGTVSIAGRKIPLTSAMQDNVLAGIYGDFRVRELTFV